ncbi:MAG: hypothetical protein JXA18_15110 [Chitinispirillaceae bacterium]|nr:hypothetical protein [Chitinispirillaceae bacterium]
MGIIRISCIAALASLHLFAATADVSINGSTGPRRHCSDEAISTGWALAG